MHGRNPNPDLAYTEAVRAVEELACPLIQPAQAARGRATLGTVIGELRGNSFGRWELLLPGQDGQPRDITHLIGMMELLWHSHVSRHGGAPKSRRQLQAEAEAMLHLAVTLTHWLTIGVLRRKNLPALPKAGGLVRFIGRRPRCMTVVTSRDAVSGVAPGVRYG